MEADGAAAVPLEGAAPRGSAGTGLGFALTLVEGRAVLGLEGRRLAPLGRVDRLDMEVPNLRFPFDFSGGVARFANRRCRLRELTVSLGADDVRGFLRAPRLRELGIWEPQVTVVGGELRLDGVARLGGREAGFTARARLLPLPARRARLSFFDVRVYGFLPVPAPMLVAALFATVGAEPGSPPVREGVVPPLGAQLLWIEGPTDLGMELVEAVLFGLLPAYGWRLPDRSAVEGTVVEGAGAGDGDGRLVLRFAANHAAGAGADPLASYDESRRRHQAGEAALLGGDLPLAVNAYRRLDPLAAGDPFAVGRLLQLLAAATSTLGEAETLAAAALERWPGFVPALLAQAAAAGEAGRRPEAQELYERVADAAEAQGTAADRAWALVAAARERALREGAPAALPLLERAVAGSPGHAGAARALSQALEGEGRWSELLRLVIQRAVDEPDPTVKAALYAEAGFLYLDRAQDPVRARDRFEQAVRLAPSAAAGWEGLGRIQGEAGRSALERAFILHGEAADRAGQARVDVALAALDEAAGDAERALERLRAAAALDDSASEPLRRAGEIEAGRNNHGEAGRLLDAALKRVRDPETRGQIVRRLAELMGGPLGEPVSARVLLEQALSRRPCDPGLLDELRALLQREGAAAEWEPFVRRAVAEARTPEERAGALARLRDVLRTQGDRPALAAVLQELAGTGGAERVEAVRELAALAQAEPESGLVPAARAAVGALLHQEEGAEATVAGSTRAELAGRLAWLLDREGDQDGALDWLRICLEGDAEAAVADAAWRRFVEIAARRGDATAAAQALVAWADDLRTAASERSRASHLVAAAEIFRERLGLASDAVALLERAISLDPLNSNAFTSLEGIAAGMGDWGRVAEVLERRLEVARSPEQKPLLERLAAVLLQLERPAAAAAAYQRLLDIDPEHGEALAFCARHLWNEGALEESAGLYERLLEVVAVPPAALAEAHLRLAQGAHLGERAGEAEEHLAAALEHEPAAGAPLAVLVEVKAVLGRGAELADRLAARAAAGGEGAARDEIARVQAGALARAGRWGEAAEVYRALLAHDRDDVTLLTGLAEICRREGNAAELRPLLERLWELAERTPEREDIDREAVGTELARLTDDPARAEAILRALLPGAAQSTPVLEALEAALLAQGADADADALLCQRVDAGDAAIAPARLVERARARVARGGPEDGPAALALLRRIDAATLDDDALRMRAELAEQGGDFVEALAMVRRLRAIEGRERLEERLGDWLLRLAARPEIPPAEAAALLEELLTGDPASQSVAEALVGAHLRAEDATGRTRAFAALLERDLPLSDATRARLHLALAESAEEAGDLAVAQTEYERALGLDSAPLERARQLVGHARILVARREVEEALVDVSDALALVPQHAPALALRADLAFRNQDWEEARRCYTELAAAPGAAEAISPELLAFRRAVLAETFGDDAEAEAAYLEVARLDAGHLEAREVLAQIALYRGDLPEAARRLEEVLRLLPTQALDKVREARHRLGEVYAELEDYAAARHYLELVLAEDPEREGALEALVGVYEHLGMYTEAAGVCERLARVYAAPELRAQALYHQGEILRERLGDLSAANDAYLRASDLDPTFTPTLLRLVHYYWNEGDFPNLVEIGAELLRGRGPEALAADGVALMLSLGAATGRRDTALARAVLHPSALDPASTAQRLAELARALGRRSPEALDPALEVLAGAAEGAVGTPLEQALVARVVAAPREPGGLVALGRVAERCGDAATARVAYGVLSAVDPAYPVVPRLTALGAIGPLHAEAWAPGAVDHDLVRGPLRRVLHTLARPLAGFGRISSRNRVTGMGLDATSLSALEEIRTRLAAPPVRAVLQTEVADAVVIGTRPVTIALGPRTAELPAAELAFVAGRALEEVRSGTFIVTALSPPTLVEVLRAVSLFLNGRSAGGADLERQMAAWLYEPEQAAFLPDAARPALLADLDEVLADPAQVEAGMTQYLRGCRFTADRVGLVTCGNPLAAVRALLARETADAPTALSELIAFLLSPAFRALCP